MSALIGCLVRESRWGDVLSSVPKIASVDSMLSHLKCSIESESVRNIILAIPRLAVMLQSPQAFFSR